MYFSTDSDSNQLKEVQAKTNTAEGHQPEALSRHAPLLQPWHVALGSLPTAKDDTSPCERVRMSQPNPSLT